MPHVHLIITGEAGHGKDTIANHLAQKLGYKTAAFADLQKEEVLSAYSTANPPVSLEWLVTRETKETPAERLSLENCDDKNFVSTALRVYEVEDKILFSFLHHNSPATLEDTVWKRLSIDQQNYIREHLDFNDADRAKLPRSPRRITQVWGTEYRRLSEHGHENYWIDPIDSLFELSTDPRNVTDGRTLGEVNWAKSAGLQRIHVERPDYGNKVATHVTEMIPPPDDDTLVLINNAGVNELINKVDSEIIPKIIAMSKSPSRRKSP